MNLSANPAWKALRDAAWLTPERARIYPRLLLAASLGLALIWIVAARGGVDLAGKPLGTDFVSFWTASQLALQGRAIDAYDVAAHWAAQKALFGPQVGYAAFFYPPPFLIVCLPLALLPYFSSLILWLAATGYAYWRVVRAWAGPAFDAAVLLAFPAFLVNAGHGQNGFLSAALIGAGALILERRPVVAGAAVRRTRLQAATRPDDPLRADRGAALDDLPRRGGDARRRCARRVTTSGAKRSGARSSTRRRWRARRSSVISSATRKCRASSRRCGCCTARCCSPMPLQGAAALAAVGGAVLAAAARLSWGLGRTGADRRDPARQPLSARLRPDARRLPARLRRETRARARLRAVREERAHRRLSPAVAVAADRRRAAAADRAADPLRPAVVRHQPPRRRGRGSAIDRDDRIIEGGLSDTANERRR